MPLQGRGSAHDQAGLAAAAPWRNVITISSIVLSAGTYLFDFISNVVVVVEYSTHFSRLLHRKQQEASSCEAACQLQTSDIAGYLYGLLAVLACSHSLNALLFKLKFTHNEAPLCAAYFLPLIHLYRLCNLLWRTLSCKGVQDVISPEMNGLYSILGSAMEGVPMLILQFCGYLVLTQEGVFLRSRSTIFKVSVAASLISVAYNGGRSVQSIAKNATSTLKRRLGAAAIGGSFTLNATVVRCLTFANVILHVREYFSRPRTERQQARFHVSDSIPLVFMAGSIVAYTLYFWLLDSPRYVAKSARDPRRLLTALAFGYMSMNLGPLYPLVSQANDAGQLGGCIFRRKLFAVSLLHLLLDLAILIVTYMLGTLRTQYLIISSLAAGGYMVSLCAYMKFDQRCGATRGFTTPAPQHDDHDADVNEHNLIPMSELIILTDAQTNSQVMMESKEVDAFSHATPSFQSARMSWASSEHADEAMACSPAEAGLFPLGKFCTSYAHQHLALQHDVHFPGGQQSSGPRMASSLSLDRGKSLTITRESMKLSMVAAQASFNRCSFSHLETINRDKALSH